jgi:hypothetical protein
MAALPWGVIIIDESHNLRTTNSRQADTPHTGEAPLASSVSTHDSWHACNAITRACAHRGLTPPAVCVRLCCAAEAAVAAAQGAARIILLTGTPSLSRPYDLYRQVDVLQPGMLGRTKEDFASRWVGA